MGVEISAPELIDVGHDISGFDCRNEMLNEWLKKKVLKNQTNNASKTYVVVAEDRVVAYYSLSLGSVNHVDVISKMKRNMPDPVPVMLIGRLAIDKEYQRKGIGKGLLKDAVLKTIAVSDIAGCKALIVHAIDDLAKEFYVRHGFQASPTKDLTLMITVKDAVGSL